MPKRIRILGTEIDDVTMGEAVFEIDALVRAKTPASVVTPNVDHLVKLQDDEEFRRVYDSAGLVLADGMPLLWAAKWIGTPLREKVSGSDLFPEVCALAAEKGYRVFFMGGRPGAADGAAKVMKTRFPRLEIAGTYCPPMGFEKNATENDKIVKTVRDSRADILFVGLGAPKQEKWIHRHKDALGVPVSLGIGVTFEFVAGMVKRAPGWMQKAGLEWFWRLLMEPARLWKRYLVDDMRFFWLLLRYRADAVRWSPASPRAAA